MTAPAARFFREPDQFEHFRSHLLPALVERARRGARVRLWSAGCASGEEAYSIALTILSALPEAAELDVRVLATDVDPDALDRAREGLYADAAVAPIDRDLRRSWFGRGRDPGGERLWRVGDDLRELVVFKDLDLTGTWPMRGPFQTIFCRNVAMEFADDVQVQVWRRLASVLPGGGLLYVGRSERVGVEEFELIGRRVYRRKKGARA